MILIIFEEVIVLEGIVGFLYFLRLENVERVFRQNFIVRFFRSKFGFFLHLFHFVVETFGVELQRLDFGQLAYDVDAQAVFCKRILPAARLICNLNFI